MIARLIALSIAQRPMVLMLACALLVASVWATFTLPVDAIPDLSDVQVIIRTEYPGQPPQVVEDQVTYPLATAMLSVPYARHVRASSMPGSSFVFVIFEDGTDLYWARSRVLEQLATIASRLPQGVSPQIGPDATGVGWVYQYALTTGRYCPHHPQGLRHDAEHDTWHAARQDAPADRRDHLALQRILPDALTHCPLDGEELAMADVSLPELRSLQDWFLRDELKAVAGVAEVASLGGYELQYQVVVDPAVLQQHGLAMGDLSDALAASNMDLGAGVVELGETEHFIQSRGYLGSRDAKDGEAPDDFHTRQQRVIDDIRQVVLRVNERNEPLRIGDIAQVRTGPAARRGLLEWRGRGETAGGIIVMRHHENARKTIAAVKERLAQLQRGLPPGVAIEAGYDRSDLIDRATHTLRHTLLQEVLVVAAVCMIFLLHARSELVAVIVVPLGILASLLVMKLLGVNANIMSLGGLAIAVGVMVDSSIIMVENAHKHLDRLHDVPQADRPSLATTVYHAAAEVGPSLFFSLLVMTVSFLPVFALDAQAGRMFTPLALTKTLAMAWAAVLSVTLIPVLMTLLIRPHVLPGRWGRRRTVAVILGVMLLPALVLALMPLHALEPQRGWIVAGWVVVSGMLLVPQKLVHEDRHPLSRFMQKLYEPCFALAIRGRWVLIVIAVLLVASIAWPWSKMGSEFMPPLEEGDLLYMPTTDPGLSITRARALLQQTDKLIASFPEVENVMGKAGRADTATDPAPLSMFETVVMLKRDKRHWRHVPIPRFFDGWPGWIASPLSKIFPTARPITVDELVHGYHLPNPADPANPIAVQGLNQALQIPGLTNSWTMPIRTRIDMLATGIRTPVGIKIMGDDLATIDRLAEEITGLIRHDAQLSAATRSIFADRNTGGHYVDIRIDRHAIARQGLQVADVQRTLSAAVGGRPVTTIIDGRARYSLSLRYPHDQRDDLPDLANVLLRNHQGRMILLSQLARIQTTRGPVMIKSENARLSGWIYIDLASGDIGSYVDHARRLVEANLDLPQGYSLVWTGQYQAMAQARSRLQVIVPVTLVVIVLLLYLATGSWGRVAMVCLALPFSLVGAFWLVYLMDYHMSVAVWVGLIALAGLDAETGLVMLLYLDRSYERFKAAGLLRGREGLWRAVHDGAVMRIRPKTMTVVTTFVGLLPLLWASGAGADTMRRLAVPMIGGLTTSFILELLIYPALFYMVKSRAITGADARINR